MDPEIIRALQELLNMPTAPRRGVDPSMPVPQPQLQDVAPPPPPPPVPPVSGVPSFPNTQGGNFPGATYGANLPPPGPPPEPPYQPAPTPSIMPPNVPQPPAGAPPPPQHQGTTVMDWLQQQPRGTLPPMPEHLRRPGVPPSSGPGETGGTPDVPAPEGTSFLDTLARTWDGIKGAMAQGEPPPIDGTAPGTAAGRAIGASTGGTRGAAPLTEPPSGTLPARRPTGTTRPSGNGGGGPGVPAPTEPAPSRAGGPSVPSAPPGQSPTEGKGGFLERNRDLWQLLSVVGLALMRPQDPGGNWLGHVGNALGAGLTYKLMTEAAQQEGARAERTLDIRESEAATRALESGARTKRIEALTPAEIAEKRATADLRRTQAATEGPEAEARIAYYRGQAGSAALARRTEIIKSALAAAKDPISGKLDMQTFRGLLAPQGINLPSLTPAERQTAQRLLAAKGKPGSPAYEAERQRLNDIAIAAGKLPEL